MYPASFNIPLTDHERRVRSMMEGFKQSCPSSPMTPPYRIRALRVRLLLEEVLEFAQAAGVSVEIPSGQHNLQSIEEVRFSEAGPGDLVEMVDALSDISVVNTGAFIACGVRQTPLLELVDANNLLKVSTGRVNPDTGKFEKAPNHPKPNFAWELKQQGWRDNSP